MTITIDIMNNSNNSSGNDGGQNPSKKRDMFMKRNSLFATDDLMFDPSMLEDEEDGYGDSLKDIFEDDDGLGGALSSNLLMPPPADKKSTSDRNSTSSSSSSSGPLSSLGSGLGKMDSADKSLSSSTWHSETSDLPHRQAMIRDIAQLLFARKKDNPSKKWLQRLPLKARMLENQLYKSAASLDAYLDRSTLKRRLGSLASAITSHYKKAMQDKKRRNSATIKLGTQGSMGASSTAASSLNGNLPKLRREASESAVKQAKSSFPVNAQNLRRQQSEPVVGMSNLPLSMGANALAGANVPANLLQQQRNNAANPINKKGVNSGSSAGNLDISSLAQQQAANEQLQNQILENIRQQREIVRRISGTDAANSMGADAASLMGNGMSLLNAGNNVMNSSNNNNSGNGMMNNLNQLQQQNTFNQLQQQQQQQMGGFGMANNPLAALQQSNQQQGGANNMNMNALLMGNTGGANNMNMMNNFGLPNVVPGTGSFSQLQQMGNAGGNMNMPPPAAMNSTGSSDDPTSLSPMSPNSFHW